MSHAPIRANMQPVLEVLESILDRDIFELYGLVSIDQMLKMQELRQAVNVRRI